MRQLLLIASLIGIAMLSGQESLFVPETDLTEEDLQADELLQPPGLFRKPTSLSFLDDAFFNSEAAFERFLEGKFPSVGMKFQAERGGSQKLDRWLDSYHSKIDRAADEGPYRLGEFTYESKGKTYQGKIALRLGKNDDGGECQGAQLYISQEDSPWAFFHSRCRAPDLKSHQETLLVDFDIEGGHEEDIGRRLLVAVPFLSDRHEAILIENDSFATRSFKVTWRTLTSTQRKAYSDFLRSVGMRVVGQNSSIKNRTR